MRYDKENPAVTKRKKRVRVEPGKSITAADIMDNTSNRPPGSGTMKKRSNGLRRQNSQLQQDSVMICVLRRNLCLKYNPLKYWTQVVM
jgi:hypothetical protein